MRQKLITLCPITWELALKKKNFSQWVRDQLRSERNKTEGHWKYCKKCDNSMKTVREYCVNSKCDGYLFAKLEELE